MFESIRSGGKQFFRTVGSLLCAPTPPKAMTFPVIGTSDSGKSTLIGQIWSYHNTTHEAGRKDMLPQPTHETEKFRPNQFPKKTGAATPFTMSLDTARGPVEVTLHDRMGSEIDLLRDDAANENNEAAREFHATLNSSDGLVLVLGPETVFAPKEEQDSHFARLADRVSEAARSAKEADRSFNLFVVYTKADRYAEPGLGDPRLFAGSRQRAAIINLWTDKGLIEQLSAAVADCPAASSGGRDLRSKLIRCTEGLYDRLRRVRDLDPRFVHAHLVQAIPSLPSGRTPSWQERGVEPFVTDLTDAISDRYSRPMSPWILLLTGAVAVVAIIFAAKEMATASDVSAFIRAQQTDLVKRTPGELGHSGLNRTDAGFDNASPVPPLDQPGRLAFLMRVNDSVDKMSSDVVAISKEPAQSRQQLGKTFLRLKSLRTSNLNWQNVVFPGLTARERAAGESLRDHVTALRDLDQALADAELSIHRCLDFAEISNSSLADRFTVAAQFATARTDALAALEKLRRSEIGSRTFVRSGGGHIEECSIGTEVIVPWCLIQEQLVDAARQKVAVGLKMAAAKSPTEYREWLYKQIDDDLAFLDVLCPEKPKTNLAFSYIFFIDILKADLPRNPFSRAFKSADLKGVPLSLTWANMDRVYAYVRVRELPADKLLTPTDLASLPHFDIDLESQAAFQVVNDERHRHPLKQSTPHGGLEVTDAVITIRPERFEIVGIFLKTRKADAYQLLPLKSRGEPILWMPALLARADRPTPALVGVPAEGDTLFPEWKRLLGAFKQASADPKH